MGVGRRLECWQLGFLTWPILRPNCRERLIHSSERVLWTFYLDFVGLPLEYRMAGILRSCLQQWHLLTVSQEFSPPLVYSPPLKVTQLKHCLTGWDNQSHLDSKPSLSLVHWHSWWHLLLFHVVVSCWLPGEDTTSIGQDFRQRTNSKIQRTFKTLTLKIQVSLWSLASKSWLFMLLIACEWHYFYLWLA